MYTRLQPRFFLFLILSTSLFASTPGFWELTTFNDFIKGKFEGIALSRDGSLSIAPKLDTWFNANEPVIWAIAKGPANEIYAATGHNGKLFRIEPNGTSRLLWTSDRPEIFAITVDPKGIVYTATSPDGKIWRIENGRATEYFAPNTKYIWSLALAADGTLYAGTGDGGRIFRITAAGRGEEYYSTNQGNVTSLLIDPQGRLLAGTEPNGILFNITAKDKASVLYDSSLPEIRAVAPGPDGSIYAVALGGSLAKKMTTPIPNANATSDANITSTTSITVTAAAGGDLKPPPAPVKPPVPSLPTADITTTTTAAADTTSDKSAIYRINADSTVETLWSSKEENIYDILPAKDGLWFGTDVTGRIYRLNERKLTLIAQTNEAEIIRLFQSNNAVLAATANMGKIYKLEAPAPQANYESSVFDTGGISRWGRFRYQGTGSIAIRTRTGNSLRPDNTWSDWASLNQTQIESPNARYLQFEAELNGNAKLENTSAAYLPVNTAPTVHSISIVSTPSASLATNKPISITATDSSDTGTPTQTISHAAAEQLNISWQADDPESDRLVYALDFRAEGETSWKSIKQDIHDTSYTIDGDALPDGRYVFRVTASDREANAEGAKDALLESLPILIDNTPPTVHITSSNRTEIVFEAQDTGSAIRRAEWSLDAGHWNPIAPVDGILDSPTEQFRLHVTIPPGEHILVIRVADTAGNTGLGKVAIK